MMAGIERAAGLIACLTEDKDNVFVTLTARQMNRNLRIISKVLKTTAVANWPLLAQTAPSTRRT